MRAVKVGPVQCIREWMARESINLVVFGALTVLSVTAVFALGELVSLDTRLSTFFESQTGETRKVQTLTETVTLPTSGRKVVVTTTQGADETIDAFIARHNATVAALQGGG